MGHSYNNGLHTSSKGITVDAVRLVDLDQADQVIAEDCKSGLIESCASGSAGTYTVQLSRPYPPKLVICLPALSHADGTSDLLEARYQTDSYDPDAGTFVILTSSDDDDGTATLTDGSATDELHIFMMFNRYTN